MTTSTRGTSTDLRRLGLIFGLAGLAAGVDLAIKALVSTQLSSGEVLDWGLVSIRLVYNPGVAFSLGSTLPSWAVTVITGVIIAGLVSFLIVRLRRLNRVAVVAAALLLGGALGNFIDRLDGRGVIDYLHTGWFATFNLADVFVTTGVVIVALAVFLGGQTSRPDDRGSG
ncbi:MAG: signal peptidase II [Actinomycetota bacterium]